MVIANLFLLFFAVFFVGLIIRLLSGTRLVRFLRRLFHSLEDKCCVYQSYKVPKFNDNMQENGLYRKIHCYLNSLPGVEESDFVNLFSSSCKSTEINLIPDENQTIADDFLGARVRWTIGDDDRVGGKSLIMKIRKREKRRILVPYLQHIHQTVDEIELKKKETKLYVNVGNGAEPARNGRWRSCPFTHPATFETMVMDADLKSRIRSDLENFLKSRNYYNRLGRVWRRSYLLYGPPGTGKSTFVVAMAKFTNYDVYMIDLNNLQNDADLKYLLLQTTKKSILVVEDLDRYLNEKSTALSLSGILNYMDGIFSCCGEERLMVFTMNTKEKVDSCVLRPGRVDVHIYFPLCDFTAFKSLANSHLGLKDHKLFPQVEEILQTGATLSPAEICEIMISNRGSPSRALKTVITALQGNLTCRVGTRLTSSVSGPIEVEQSQNGIHPMKEIKNLYGFLKARSCRKMSMDKLDVHERDHSDSVHES